MEKKASRGPFFFGVGRLIFLLGAADDCDSPEEAAGRLIDEDDSCPRLVHVVSFEGFGFFFFFLTTPKNDSIVFMCGKGLRHSLDRNSVLDMAGVTACHAN